MDIYDRLAVRKVVNARGCFTLAGGSLMDAEVLAALHEAAGRFVRIEDLQDAASRVIARLTGAEAGYVTSGAAAAVTLGTAACLARLDVDRMRMLPDTTAMANEVVVHRSHRNPYDHMVRAAGAVLVEFGEESSATVEQMQAAIGPRTVAAFFDADSEFRGLPFDAFVATAHDSGVPVIVDAAISLPPPSNLRRFTEGGGDLVAFSGGKSIRGPQSSGFLAGRRDLLLSVALQHQDMDVHAATWSRRGLIEQGVLARPPEHGIGRSMKAGKEEIAALVVALERYAERDHDAERTAWMHVAEVAAEALAGIEGLTALAEDRHLNGRRPVPSTRILVDEARYGMSAVDVVLGFHDLDPIILVVDDEADSGRLALDSENLAPEDIPVLVDAFRRNARPASAPAMAPPPGSFDGPGSSSVEG